MATRKTTKAVVEEAVVEEVKVEKEPVKKTTTKKTTKTVSKKVVKPVEIKPIEELKPEITKFYKVKTGVYGKHIEAGVAYIKGPNVTTMSFSEGTSVSVHAVPKTKYFFKQWVNEKGEFVSKSNPYTFTMPAKEVEIYATFGQAEIPPQPKKKLEKM